MKNYSFKETSRPNRFVFLFLAFFVAAAFYNCLQNDFVGDDKALFVGNEFYKNPHNLLKIFSADLVMKPSYSGDFQKPQSFSGCVSYRPVTVVTFFLDYALWKEHPVGHHLMNMVLHFLTAVLVFYFIFEISKDVNVAFWTASLFAVYPIQSEVVNASSYRSDILMTFFYLSAILAYLRWRTAKKKGRWLLVVCAAYFMALFSKEAALTCPVMILLIEWFFPCSQNSQFSLREKGLLSLSLIGISGFYLYVYFALFPNIFYLHSTPLTLKGLALGVVMLKIFSLYLEAFFFPWETSILPPLYAPPVFPLTFWDIITPLSAAMGLAVVGIYFYRRNKIVTWAVAWFFMTYFPISGFFPLLNPLAYRFLYLPSIGLFLLGSLALQFFFARLDQKKFSLNIPFLLQTALFGLLIVLTIGNNTFFKNDFVACREMIRRYPKSSRPYWVLGFNNYLAGNFDESVKYLEKHLTVDINNPFISSDKEKFMTYHLLGKACAKPDRAIEYLNKALAIYPGFAPAYLDLSRNYIIQKDYPTALGYAQKAALLDSRLVLADVYIVHITIEQGNFSLARALLDKAQKKFAGDENLKAVERYLQLKEKKK